MFFPSHPTNVFYLPFSSKIEAGFMPLPTLFQVFYSPLAFVLSYLFLCITVLIPGRSGTLVGFFFFSYDIDPFHLSPSPGWAFDLEPFVFAFVFYSRPIFNIFHSISCLPFIQRCLCNISFNLSPPSMSCPSSLQ